MSQPRAVPEVVKNSDARASTTHASFGRTERKRLRVHNRLYDAALRLFVTQGYEATAMDQIGEAADVARAPSSGRPAAALLAGNGRPPCGLPPPRPGQPLATCYFSAILRRICDELAPFDLRQHLIGTLDLILLGRRPMLLALCCRRSSTPSHGTPTATRGRSPSSGNALDLEFFLAVFMAVLMRHTGTRGAPFLAPAIDFADQPAEYETTRYRN